VLRPASLLAVALLLFACTPPSSVPRRTATPAVIVLPTELPNGRVEVAVQPSYVIGVATRVDIMIIASRGTITGPTDVRVMASGINEGNAPAEVLVRRLAAPSTVVSAGRRATTSVTWDGVDEFGARVPADAYVLLLDFESVDGESTRTVRAAATLQMTD
jgi:hypothetical protein